MEIHTPRLKLRRLSKEDIDHIYLLDNDPEVMRFNNGGIATPRNLIETKLLPTMLPGEGESSCLGFWAVVNKIDKQFLGWVSLRQSNHNAESNDLAEAATTATIGYRFRRAVWGKGFATEAMTKLLETGFTLTGIRVFQATTYEKNTASIRVMQKLGMQFSESFRFTEEDQYKSDTTYTDNMDIWEGYDVRYTLSKIDWLAQQSAGTQ